MKAKCITDVPYFPVGKLYHVSHIDDDGDVWVVQDDCGDAHFFFPDECEVIQE